MSSDSDEEIGARAEATLKKPSHHWNPESERRYTPRLTAKRRDQAIETFYSGKEDPEYFVRKLKNGGLSVNRRRTPLEEPPEEKALALPKRTDEREPPKEKSHDDIPVISYFNNQQTVNQSLLTQLGELKEWCSRLDEKYTKQKQKKAIKKIRKQEKAPKAKPQKEESDDEPEPTDEEIEAYMREQYAQTQAETEPSPSPPPPRPIMRPRRVIDIHNY
jgi:hypothetical protein